MTSTGSTVKEIRALASDLRNAPATSMVGTHISVPVAQAAAVVAALSEHADDIDRREVLRIERDHARECYRSAINILAGIHALLYPKKISSAGMAFEFHSPLVHEQMQALSDRIRAIPDEIGKLQALWPVAAEPVAQSETVDIEALRNRVASVVNQLPDEWQDFAVELRDDLTELTAARPRAVPDGWVLVPRDPSEEMLQACIGVWQERLKQKAANGTLLCGGDPRRSFTENYTAMLAAAPSAPTGE